MISTKRDKKKENQQKKKGIVESKALKAEESRKFLKNVEKKRNAQVRSQTGKGKKKKQGTKERPR